MEGWQCLQRERSKNILFQIRGTATGRTCHRCSDVALKMGLKAVASLGEQIAPGDILQGVTPDLKSLFLWLNLERTRDKRRGKMGVMRWQQKRSSLSEAMTKKCQIFQKKIGWHPSVTAPGDTNPSDATGWTTIFLAGIVKKNVEQK